MFEGQTWSQYEIDYLTKWYGKKFAKEIAIDLNRSYESVRSKAQRLYLSSFLKFKKPKTLKIGDIISYKQNNKGPIITHRITDISFTHGQYFFYTKGDNNEEKDPQPISEKEIIGKVIASIPYLGIVVFNKNKLFFIISILLGFISGVVFKGINL